jgi:acetylornithine deacetylase/succinyl-diaminopimelate desuccinylase-like protein
VSARLAAAALGTFLLAGAAGPKETVRTTRAWVSAHERDVLAELSSFLSIPNVSSDAPNIRKNAEALVSMLDRRGLTARLLVPKGGGPPAVFAELAAPGAKRTIAVYAHYDGQPVEPKEWASPPFSPTLRDRPLEEEGARVLALAGKEPLSPEARLYARGASDDKGSIVAILAGLDALRASGRAPSVNVKLFFEGEEEAGSPHLGALLAENAKLLAADLWLLCDGPVHQSRRMQVVFGARGVTDVEVTVYGPLKALHSGHYGNWAPNPALELAHLVAGLRDRDGKILVDGFEKDARAPTAAEKRAIADVPDVDGELRTALALAPSERAVRLVESVLSPAINVRGLLAGHVGAGAANAIPTEAHASIDFRLVPDQTPEKVRARIEAHLAKQGYHLVSETPDPATRRAHERVVKLAWGAGYPPARTLLDSPAARAVTSVLDAALERPVLKVPTLGGSIPMYLFAETLKIPVLILPIANHDNNQHAANENLRLQNLKDGIDLYAVLFGHLGPALDAAR